MIELGCQDALVTYILGFYIYKTTLNHNLGRHVAAQSQNSTNDPHPRERNDIGLLKFIVEAPFHRVLISKWGA